MEPDLRAVLLVIGLLFCGLFALMTLSVVAQSGIDVLSVTAFAIVALVLFGLLGALRNPPGK
jgi:hypothetical protein